MRTRFGTPWEDSGVDSKVDSEDTSTVEDSGMDSGVDSDVWCEKSAFSEVFQCFQGPVRSHEIEI